MLIFSFLDSLNRAKVLSKYLDGLSLASVYRWLATIWLCELACLVDPSSLEIKLILSF